MKRDHRALSLVREASPFVTPPRVLVVAEDDGVGEAVSLAESLDGYGADAEVRFDGEPTDWSCEPDAVIFAGKLGFRVGRHHPVLETVLRFQA